MEEKSYLRRAILSLEMTGDIQNPELRAQRRIFVTLLMSTRLVTNVKCLYGTNNYDLRKGGALADLPYIENAYLLTEGKEIGGFGKMQNLTQSLTNHPAIDAAGRLVLPAWCDSHSHLLYTGSRENEFIDKIQGATYAEIAGKGGGI